MSGDDFFRHIERALDPAPNSLVLSDSIHRYNESSPADEKRLVSTQACDRVSEVVERLIENDRVVTNVGHVVGAVGEKEASLVIAVWCCAHDRVARMIDAEVSIIGGQMLLQQTIPAA